ncbi:MAG TPA: M20 family metallopeptidase [Streptosporangiaceae bacterium]|nr:M20 family metallopeptidase [Streptosporangiaceae bacterium]
MGAGILDDAAAISAEIAELRHSIHREPEIGLELPKTQRKVLEALDGLPLEISCGQSLSSVTAVLRGARPGKTVLLRGDMDALPVDERTGVPYASQVPGTMHACGHDLHTAMLAGAARLLSARQADLAGNVIFMFQPGEEGSGGARIMISEGVLEAAGEHPAAAFALHVASGVLPLGLVASRAGTAMAAADTLHVTARGRGGHGSQPHLAADPIPAACEMVTALQTMVTRRFDVFDPVVLTVGTFHAGTTDNVIPDDAAFVATVRTFSPQSRDRIRDAALQLIRQIAAAHDLDAYVAFVDGYPVTVNDQAEFGFAEQTAGELLGEGKFLTAPFPMTGSEDFSYVLEQVPGAFLMVGACPAGTDPATAPYNHSAEAVFDDAVLADGTALYAELARRKLSALAAQPAG